MWFVWGLYCRNTIIHVQYYACRHFKSITISSICSIQMLLKHYSIQTRKCAAHYLFSYLHRYFPLEIMFAKFKMSTYIEKLSWKCSFMNYFKPNHYHSFPAHGMHSTPTCKKGWYYSNDTFDVQFQPQEKQTNKQTTNQPTSPLVPSTILCRPDSLPY